MPGFVSGASLQRWVHRYLKVNKPHCVSTTSSSRLIRNKAVLRRAVLSCYSHRWSIMWWTPVEWSDSLHPTSLSHSSCISRVRAKSRGDLDARHGVDSSSGSNHKGSSTLTQQYSWNKWKMKARSSVWMASKKFNIKVIGTLFHPHHTFFFWGFAFNSTTVLVLRNCRLN